MKTSHLNALRALEATLRTGSFSDAAGELGVTPAAVGQQIRKLEAYLGVELFQRTRRGVAPTPDAARVAGRLTAGFSGLSDALAALRDRRRGPRLAVTLPASFAENWLAPRIHGFYGIRSEVDLRLDATNRMVDLFAEDFDFALRYSRPAAEGLEEIDLFGDVVLPACAPEFAQRHALTPETRSLEGVPLVHLDARTPDPSWPDWPDWGARFGFARAPLRRGFRFTQVSSGLQSALSGQGLVLCGVTEAFAALREGRLVAPFGPQRHCATAYRYRLVWVEGRGRSACQQDFIAWIRRAAAAFAAEVGDLLRPRAGVASPPPAT